MSTAVAMTLDALELMPEDERGEVIRGAMLPVCSVGWLHGDVAARTAARLGSWVWPRRLGDLGVEAGFAVAHDPLTVLAPDVAFVRADRLPPPERQDKMFPFAPDLAVEVVSPSESSTETQDKVLLYLDAETPLVWVIHPRSRTVTAYTADRAARIRGEGDVLDGGDVLSGFSLPVADLIA